MDPVKFRRALGDELRRLRLANGWTQPKLADEASNPITVRALQSYEAGARELSALKLLELCRALRCDLTALVARVTARLGVEDPGTMRLDLRAVHRDDTGDLLPLRQWARVQLASVADDDVAVVALSPAAVDALAELCNMRRGHLVRRINALSPPRRRSGGAR